MEETTPYARALDEFPARVLDLAADDISAASAPPQEATAEDAATWADVPRAMTRLRVGAQMLTEIRHSRAYHLTETEREAWAMDVTEKLNRARAADGGAMVWLHEDDGEITVVDAACVVMVTVQASTDLAPGAGTYDLEAFLSGAGDVYPPSEGTGG